MDRFENGWIKRWIDLKMDGLKDGQMKDNQIERWINWIIEIKSWQIEKWKKWKMDRLKDG